MKKLNEEQLTNLEGGKAFMDSCYMTVMAWAGWGPIFGTMIYHERLAECWNS